MLLLVQVQEEVRRAVLSLRQAWPTAVLAATGHSLGTFTYRCYSRRASSMATDGSEAVMSVE